MPTYTSNPSEGQMTCSKFTMQLQLPTLPGGVAGTMYTIAAIVAAAFVISGLSNYHKLDGIPTFGSSGWLGSWRAARKFKSDGDLLIQEGYRKHKGLPFKLVDSAGNWLVLVSSRQHIEELRKAPDDVLSFRNAATSSMKLKYIMGREISQIPYHLEVVRGSLTRNLSNLYPEIQDEISVAFDEVLDLRDNEWKTISAVNTMQKVVCRVSNRIFVGLPLCRDPDWIAMNVQYAMDVVDAGNKIKRFGDFLASFVVRFMTDIPTAKERATKYLAPMIEERQKLLEEHGNNWDGRPNDMLSWFMEEAPEGVERTARFMANRVLTINFSAIHTSSNSFTYALFFLAENPQYVQPLRDEVEAIVQKEGWSKASLGKMRMIDSFLKESQRLIGIGSLAMVRLAGKNFTFSDGTFIPKGTFLAATSRPLHLDDEFYENANVFNPFRFSDMCDEDRERHFVSTGPEYLSWGYGKHSCPGRFFAADELKSMLAHIIVTYDVKLEDNKPRPQELRIGTAFLANPSSKVMFRKRAY